MQDKQITNAHQKHPQALSPRELQLIAAIKEPLQARCDPSPEAMEQLILTLPGEYREMAIQAVAEQFILSIKLYLLQLATTFCSQVQREGYHEGEPDETLQDIEASFQEIFTLNQRLNIDSIDKLFKLGKLAVHVMDLSGSNTVEETESSLYSIPALYQGWLEQMSLIKDA